MQGSFDRFSAEDEQTGSNWFLLSQTLSQKRKLLLLLLLSFLYLIIFFYFDMMMAASLKGTLSSYVFQVVVYNVTRLGF